MKNKLNITIVGLGLIGGSLAASLKNVYGTKVSIVGIDNNARVLKQAAKSGFFSEVALLKKSKMITNSRVVFVAAGIDSTPFLFEELGKIDFVKKIIITDVGSVKAKVFKQALKKLPIAFDFVGGHPIAGTEKTGFQNLVPDLFQGRPVFISGTRASKESVSFIKKIWKSLGSLVYSVTPEEHDKIFAYLSHMPHVLAFGLNSLTKKNLPHSKIVKYGGTSYKDYSRISESPEDLWSEIFLSNRKNLIKGIKDFRKYLDKLENLLKDNTKDKIQKHLKS